MKKVPYRIVRKVRVGESRSPKNKKEVDLPRDLEEELLSSLEAYLPEEGVAITEGVFPPGASEPYIAEAGAYQHAWRAYSAAWQMFGLGATKEQVGRIAWRKLGIFSPFAQKALNLPKRPEDVASWLWHLVKNDN
ncbi:MAG: hypothetical protein U9M98_02475 [Patescibacteria group bacterium]|nr:hypothetical protein [Patescibacteria group bacterium]